MREPKPVSITHTCGHTVEHRAWGERVAWLTARPCPSCAGVRVPGVEAQPATKQGDTARAPIDVAPWIAGLPAHVTEFRFAHPRRWRFDFAWPERKVALEVEGSPGFGRHTYPKGFLADIEKYNAATVLGWRVVRCVRRVDNIEGAVEALRKLLL